ncbi:MAG: hypothetical protein ACLQE4_20245, partial [Mycobacterium sp.]
MERDRFPAEGSCEVGTIRRREIWQRESLNSSTARRALALSRNGGRVDVFVDHLRFTSPVRNNRGIRGLPIQPKRPKGASIIKPEASFYPVRVRGDLDSALSRWQWLVKWILAIPHYIVLLFLRIAFAVVTVIAFFAILFT